jgi:hypothetical protein
MTSWNEVLDQMEQRLRDTEQVIARNLVPVEPFALPEDLGPLPAECQDRAVKLYAATRDAERRLTIALGQVGAELRSVQNTRPRPAYVDRLA